MAVSESDVAEDVDKEKDATRHTESERLVTVWTLNGNDGVRYRIEMPLNFEVDVKQIV